MTTPNSSSPQFGVSRQALSIARILERLPAGAYTINVSRPEHSSERWTIEVFQIVVALKELVDHTQEENKSGDISKP